MAMTHTTRMPPNARTLSHGSAWHIKRYVPACIKAATHAVRCCPTLCAQRGDTTAGRQATTMHEGVAEMHDDNYI